MRWNYLLKEGVYRSIMPLHRQDSMKKFTKLIVGITLLLFLGQSFASMIMSCDLPIVQSSDTHTQSTIHGSGHSQAVGHSNHFYNSDSYRDVTVKSLSVNSDCESGQHSCKCDMGTCSLYFLPINGYSMDQDSAVLLTESSDVLSSFQSSLVYRPPISA